MATKLKKSRPVSAVILLVVSICLLVVPVLYYFSGWHDPSYYGLDYKQTTAYENTVVPNLLTNAWSLAKNVPAKSGVTSDGAPIEADAESVDLTLPDYIPAQQPLSMNGKDWVQGAAAELTSNGALLSFYIANDYGSSLSYNTAAADWEAFQKLAEARVDESHQSYRWYRPRASQAGFDHFILVKDGQVTEMRMDRTGLKSTTVPLYQSPYALWLDSRLVTEMEQFKGYAIALAVTNETAFLPNAGVLYRTYYYWYTTMALVLWCALPALVGLLALLFTLLLRRRDLALAFRGIAGLTGSLWLEVKAVILIFALFFNMEGIDNGDMIMLAGGICLVLLGLNDLLYNKKKVFTNNGILWAKHRIADVVQSMESKYPFAKRLKQRYLYWVGGAGLLGIFGFGMALFGEPEPLIIGSFAGVAGVALLVLFGRKYFRTVEELGTLTDYAKSMRNGTAQEPLRMSADSDFAAAAADLSQIHNGLARMVEDRIRSEKMKVELVTNVSHDLKTPLTSIINYVDLLDKESLSPSFANDYVDILAQKSQRLKNLVQDLFEISRANSGDAELNLEQLNVNALVEQTVAELEELSGQNGLEVKLALDKQSPVVRADGRKLHRVLENLLGNSVKYALSGTRVYVEVKTVDSHVTVTFKNISGYEMQFSAEEIVERFSRGDSARSTDGSGLGLAIAKSFLELNGGALEIQLDGDLFKAIAHLPLYVPYEQRTTPQPEEYTIVDVATAVPVPAAAPTQNFPALSFASPDTEKQPSDTASPEYDSESASAVQS